MILEIRNVSKTFDDKKVLDNISFSLERGEIIGLLGPNGAGKTTLLRIILDIIKADEGDVLLFGASPSHLIYHRLGYLPEERGLYRRVKILDILLYIASLKEMGKEKAMERVRELLTRIDLLEYMNKKTSDLSKGMLQKLQLASALVHDPELLILDEPFSGLDPVGSREIAGLISEERNKGKGIILATHQMNVAERLCDTIFLIHDGREVIKGLLGDIKKDMCGKITPSPERMRQIEELNQPSLEEIFISLLGEHDSRPGAREVKDA